MNNQRYLLQLDSVRAKRGGHGKPKARRGAAALADELPRRESMRRSHVHDRKMPNGKNYTVLKRFLRGCVGQPWDAVYSELCHRLRPGHNLDMSAREWLHGFVLQNVYIDDAGEVREQAHDCALWDDFYVHPETGKLGFVGRPKRHRREQKPLVETKKVGDVVRYAKQNGIWYEVTLQPIPTKQQVQTGVPSCIGNDFMVNPDWLRPRGPVDVILKARAMAQDEGELGAKTYMKTAPHLRVFRAAWGAFVYAAHKRQLNGDELAREGLRNDTMA